MMQQLLHDLNYTQNKGIKSSAQAQLNAVSAQSEKILTYFGMTII